MTDSTKSLPCADPASRIFRRSPRRWVKPAPAAGVVDTLEGAPRAKRPSPAGQHYRRD